MRFRSVNHDFDRELPHYPPKVYISVNYATRCASLSLSHNRPNRVLEDRFVRMKSHISKIHTDSTVFHSQTQLTD